MVSGTTLFGWVACAVSLYLACIGLAGSGPGFFVSSRSLSLVRLFRACSLFPVGPGSEPGLRRECRFLGFCDLI